MAGVDSMPRKKVTPAPQPPDDPVDLITRLRAQLEGQHATHKPNEGIAPPGSPTLFTVEDAVMSEPSVGSGLALGAKKELLAALDKASKELIAAGKLPGVKKLADMMGMERQELMSRPEVMEAVARLCNTFSLTAAQTRAMVKAGLVKAFVEGMRDGDNEAVLKAADRIMKDPEAGFGAGPSVGVRIELSAQTEEKLGAIHEVEFEEVRGDEEASA